MNIKSAPFDFSFLSNSGKLTDNIKLAIQLFLQSFSLTKKIFVNKDMVFSTMLSSNSTIILSILNKNMTIWKNELSLQKDSLLQQIKRKQECKSQSLLNKDLILIDNPADIRMLNNKKP